MDSIEAEAMRRAQEMHWGKNRNNPYPSPPANNNQRKQSNAERQSHNTKKEIPDKEESTQTYSGEDVPFRNDSFLGSSIFEDKEKLLILVLILILTGEENSDLSIVLALLYLII